MMHSYHLCHDFNRALPVEAFARANVHQVSDLIQLLLAVYRQICALGQELANQAVDVLVTASLPRAMRVAEVNGYTSVLRDLGVLGHLPALVVSHALAHRQRHPIKRCTEALHRRRGRRVAHLHQHQVAAGPFNQCTDRRCIGLAFDQVTFPVSWHKAVFNFRRAHVNTDHVGNLPTTVNAATARSSRALALTQADDQLLTQLANRQGVDRVIDGLTTDVGVFKTGNAHAAQLAGNLLWRKALAQQGDNQLKQFAAGQQPSLRPTGLAPGKSSALSSMGNVRSFRPTVTTQLSADCGWTTAQQTGDCSLTQAVQLADLDRDAFFNAEFVIGHRADTLPKGSGVALSFRGRPAFAARRFNRLASRSVINGGDVPSVRNGSPAGIFLSWKSCRYQRSMTLCH